MRSFLFLPLALLALTPVFAQRVPAPARILGPINSAVTVRLQKSAPAAAFSRYDVGVAPANAEIKDARIVLARTPEQQQALNTYIAEEMDSASPNYHKWLTPQQFGKRYGLDPADISTIVQWLESRGFTVRPVPAGRDVILFSGSVASIEATFEVHIHQFRRDGRAFLLNADAPSVPAALAPVIRGVSGLGTFRAQPLIKLGQPLKFNPEKKEFVPQVMVGPNFVGLVPGDWATIYNAPNTLNANFNASSGKEYTGSGVTIGIVGDGPVNIATVQNYWQLFIKPFLTSANQVIIENFTANRTGPYTSGDSVEAFLDMEIAGGLAPGATIVYYEDFDPDNSLLDAINADKADIISISFGICEGTPGDDDFSEYTQQAAAQGQTVVVAADDYGAAGCDPDADEQNPAVNGFGVNSAASTPYNVAVGGTDSYGLTQDFSEYVSSKERSDYSSVVGYIPETVWNDTIASPTDVAEDAPPSIDYGPGAGGGGISTVYSKPSWQTGPGIPDNNMRALPDVSLLAGNGVDGSDTVICDDDPASTAANAPLLDCAANSEGQFQSDSGGGTSTAAPAFAGMLAMVEQKVGSRLGNAVQELYALYNSADGPSVFHDITTGNNSVPCKEGTPDCTLDSAGFYYLTGYNAGPGYNLATGLGSVNITNLVNDWGAGPTTAPSLLTPVLAAKVTSNTLANNQTISVDVSVTAPASSDPVPTGTVTLAADSYTSSATTLTNGTATISIPAGTFTAAGPVSLAISFSGDSNYDPANISTDITVTTPPAVALTAAAPTAVSPGATASSTLQIVSENGYVGSITLGCTLTSSPTGAVSAPTCSVPTTPVTLADAQTTTATVNFATTSGTQSKNNAPVNPWEKGGLGTALAAVLLLSIPSKNRAWRNILCALVIASTIGLVTACGGNSGQPAPPPAPPTTAGTYTYTIQATGDPALAVQPVTTVSVTVN